MVRLKQQQYERGSQNDLGPEIRFPIELFKIAKQHLRNE